MTLYDRTLQDMLIFMYKVKNGLVSESLKDIFQINNDEESIGII